MLVGPLLPPKHVPLIRERVRASGAPGEETLAVLALVRTRSEVSALVVTTRRLLTLGRPARGYPVLEEFSLLDVLDVRVERDSLLAQGRVRMRTSNGVHSLGILTPTGDERAAAVLDRAMGQARRGEGRHPASPPDLPGPHLFTIPVPRSPHAQLPGTPPQDDPPHAQLPGTPPQDDPPGHAGAGDGRPGSLVEQLGELAGLHSSGALTDEEFAAAKSRLLAGR